MVVLATIGILLLGVVYCITLPPKGLEGKLKGIVYYLMPFFAKSVVHIL
jgi:hypothetical protein